MFRAYFGWPSILSLMPFLVAYVCVTGFGPVDAQMLAGVRLPWASCWNASSWLAVGLLLTWPLQFARLHKFAHASGADRVLLEALLDARKSGRAPGRKVFLRGIFLVVLLQIGSVMTVLPGFAGKAGTGLASGIFIWACFQTFTMTTLCFLIDYRFVAKSTLPAASSVDQRSAA